MRPADRAWIALATGVVVYDVLAPPSQTLSEGADRYMLTHPWKTRAVAAAVAAHVCNAIPARFDPIHLLFAGARAWRGGAMDFSALPPEINSGLIYTGAGPGPLIEAAQSWNTLSQGLSSTATEYGSAVTSLAGTWAGPSSAAMQAAARPFLAWLEATASQAAQTAAQADTAAAAYSAARAASVPPTVITANRALLLHLIATNLLGQNTPTIIATEAAYEAMWAQDAAAMNAYAASSSAATGALPQFTPAPPATTGSVPAAATQPSATTTLLQFIQQLIPGFTPGDALGNLADLLTSPLLSGFISSGAYLDAPIALLVGLLGFSMITAATQESARAIANAGKAVGYGGNASVVMPPVEPVKAATGVGNNLGRLCVPPSWAQPKSADVSAGQGPAGRPLSVKGQTAIPAVPFMPVTGLRSNQGKVRTDPEYGHVSKVLPPRNPAAG